MIPSYIGQRPRSGVFDALRTFAPAKVRSGSNVTWNVLLDTGYLDAKIVSPGSVVWPFGFCERDFEI